MRRQPKWPGASAPHTSSGPANAALETEHGARRKRKLSTSPSECEWATGQSHGLGSVGPAVGLHAPDAVRTQNEAIRGGSRSIAEDFRMVSRIDTVQAAGPHGPTVVRVVSSLAIRHSDRSSAQDDQCGSDRERAQGFLSTHDGLLPVADAMARTEGGRKVARRKAAASAQAQRRDRLRLLRAVFPQAPPQTSGD